MVIGSKRTWFLAALAAAVVALVAAFWFGRPAYRHYKEVRSMKLAQAALSKGDDRSAFLELRVALAINSSNLAATRLMADLFDRGQSPAALGWRRRWWRWCRRFGSVVPPIATTKRSAP